MKKAILRGGVSRRPKRFSESEEMTGNDYGPGFQKAREAALARSNGVCQACGHFRATAAHHWQKRYSPDSEITPEHLTGLCDLCHEMVTALRKTLSAAESEKRSEAREVRRQTHRKTENLHRGIYCGQGGYHFPDEGFVRIAETLFTRYISGESEQLEQHHTILLGAWRGEGKRRVSDLNKREATELIEMLKNGDWARPAPKPAPALRAKLLLPNRLRLRSRSQPRLPRPGAPRLAGASRVLGRGADGRYSSCSFSRPVAFSPIQEKKPR